MTVFVWVQGLKGPEPQKAAEPLASVGSDYWSEKGGRILATHALSAADSALSLDALAVKYPAPSREPS